MIYSPEQLQLGSNSLTSSIGGKGYNLLKLFGEGFSVPDSLFLSTGYYEEFVEHNNLREKIELEMHRKDLAEMRWEEIWDIALRIQSLFLQGSFPRQQQRDIDAAVREKFGDSPLAVRSSAPGEDGASNSFAGLHESYLNVSAGEELFVKIKKIWASLWSDRAILYRQELGLSVASSSMAILIQELLLGDCSGVVFSCNPLDESQLVIEAVYGLNQGLVDGAIEPDRWTVQRDTLQIVDSYNPKRTHYFTKDDISGVNKVAINPAHLKAPPLQESQILEICRSALQLEKLFLCPQDIEWTYTGEKLHILQTRPVTAGAQPDAADKRPWYLSLTRSYDNLMQLWGAIEQELLPAMDVESQSFAEVALDELSDAELAKELEKRDSANSRWTGVYWNEFIPFAHGARLFGEIYNEVIQPDDPFEFVLLLTGQNMLSTRRNRLLHECAQLVKEKPDLQQQLRDGKASEIRDEIFQAKMQLLTQQFAMADEGEKECISAQSLIPAMILQYAKLDIAPGKQKDTLQKDLESGFIERAAGKIPFDPGKLLEMARASYRIRDDDNIHIGRINRELDRAVSYARSRLSSLAGYKDQQYAIGDLVEMLITGEVVAAAINSDPEAGKQNTTISKVKARQLQGQAASRGIARGKARVVLKNSDLTRFQKGEILVIDSIDPTMTFFAPLAAGIIERRGGMLIHGAIIAREYGIPCVTGITEATKHIRTGDTVTVDGYLGICTIQRH